MAAKLDTRVFHSLSYGLYIVTSQDNDRRNGQLIISPSRLLPSLIGWLSLLTRKILLLNSSRTAAFSRYLCLKKPPPRFYRPFRFQIRERHRQICQSSIQNRCNRGPLVIEHALSVMKANVIEQIDSGTHTIFVGEVVRSEVLKEERPLTYQYYHENLKGKTPPNAPTFK